MSITGKYDFQGIKKWGAKGVLLALATVPYFGPFMVKYSIVSNFTEAVVEQLINWLTNRGLIIMNVGAITVEGHWDQVDFDKALDDAFKRMEIVKGVPLTPAQAKAIDDIVIVAFRKFAPITNHNT